MKMNLPFKVGQVAEARTFEEGFRGAWFRCKIRKISKKKGKLGHVLEYIDFTEEKLDWTKLYQVPSHYEGNIKGKHGELMVRPPYPPIYKEKQMPHVSEITEDTVIGGDSWRVGNLVDWWTNDCFWSGRITQLLGDDAAQIELPPPPLGEGSSDKALLKDLRPSLDWSPELGWTVPTQEGDPCARVVKPVNQVIDRVIQVEDLHNAGQETEAGQRPASSLLSSPVPSNSAIPDAAKSITATEMRTCSPGKAVSKKRKHKQERNPSQGADDSSRRETSRVVADSGQNRAEPAAEIAQEELNPGHSQVTYIASGRLVLHSKCSDRVEAAILDLEEYVNKVKWLKKLMQCGISSSGAQVPHWEFE
ncbi:uncharacterized protein LOC131006911 [Salvia miltiorrhiza]|uniref:uncharacterized protein LOC131006911 n=1 Tax=Salvia miltiorrhiza TaxID=226208 RepID=UPI0025AD2C22|nr:uncharacterized protein LOC131006911 [Salvia miltiorrhiza]